MLHAMEDGELDALGDLPHELHTQRLALGLAQGPQDQVDDRAPDDDAPLARRRQLRDLQGALVGDVADGRAERDAPHGAPPAGPSSAAFLGAALLVDILGRRPLHTCAKPARSVELDTRNSGGVRQDVPPPAHTYRNGIARAITTNPMRLRMYTVPTSALPHLNSCLVSGIPNSRSIKPLPLVHEVSQSRRAAGVLGMPTIIELPLRATEHEHMHTQETQTHVHIRVFAFCARCRTTKTRTT